MVVEMIDIVDESGAAVGTMTRAEAERLNRAIPNVLIFLFTPDNKVWIQKRAMHKKHFPGMWDISACGAVASGESPETGATRETFEETGIKTDLKFVETFMNIFPGEGGQTFRRLSYLYIGETDQTPKANHEVEEFKAINTRELLKQLDKQPQKFIPSFLIELQKAITARSEKAVRKNT